MGFKDFLNKQVAGWKEAKQHYEIGCEIMGPPSDPASTLQRAGRMRAGKKELARREQEDVRKSQTKPKAPRAGSDPSADSEEFSKTLSDGTIIYAPRGIDKKPGHKHGHKGSDFDRTPHSTIGSAAIDRPHTVKDHKTDRW